MATLLPVTALHQGTPEDTRTPWLMTWLGDPPPWLCPALIAWYGNSVDRTLKIPYLIALFVLFSQWRWRPVFWMRRLKKVVNFFEENVHPGLRFFWPRNDLAPLLRWRLPHDLSDLEMTWLPWSPVAATVCYSHRRIQGVQWVHLHPPGQWKKISGLIYRKNVKVHPPRTRSAPPARVRVNFYYSFLLSGLDLEVYLDGLWGRRLKKVVDFFC